VFTKAILPPLLILAMIAGLFTGFSLDYDKLQPSYADASMDLSDKHEYAAELLLPAAGIGDSYTAMDSAADRYKSELSGIKSVLVSLAEDARQESALAAQQKQAVDAAVNESAEHSKEAGDVLDTVLSNILGKPIGQTFGKKATIKVFSLKEAGYSGYMAKIKMHDPSALKLVLSGDTIGHKGETTSAAAKRTDAVLAINGGGFARQDGLLYPMGITVIDGEIKTFYSTELSFIGINKSGHLVGGDIDTREGIEELDVMYGASFVPTLLKDGKKQTIPSKWKNKKEPRTLIGHFSNGDLLLIVIDGRSKQSGGVTLEEAQTKLLEWNVRDAYTLDGGGSSTFVYKGKVLNTPSDGSERRVVSNFVITP
jgi:exopolysaccharide biosynthesis protein